MKRLFTIITLIVSSFFLFSINEVRAETNSYELSENYFDYIDETFLTFRENVIKYVEDNNLEVYIIYSLSVGNYRAYVNNDGYSLYSTTPYGANSVLQFYFRNYTKLKPDASGEIVVDTSSTAAATENILSSSSVLQNYIDTNIPLQYNGAHEYIINYNDSTYTISKGSYIPTLYQIYLEHNKPVEPDDPYEEEKNIINNFYSTTIAKIGDLATTFANNYVFILIFGIFILIFVIELIRRYLL